MKVGIDARFYGIKNKGLGRYTEKLIEELEKIDNTNQYFIFLKKENFSEYQPQANNFHKVLADFPWYTWKEQILFNRLIKKCKCDLMHFLHFNVPLTYKGKFVVTIHDLTLFHFPTYKNSTHNWLFYKIKYLIYYWVIRKAILRANKIIAISQSTTNDIIKYFGEKQKQKIKVIYEAAPYLIKSEKFSKIISKYNISKPYLLYVGNAYPHKNLERLLQAFQIFKKNNPDYCLVLAGKKDYFYQQLRKYINQEKIKSIVILDTINDAELKTLYREAELFVFPSLYEGFGLPPLEAMQEGLPVVSSDHSCMREILGSAAYYFNGKDIQSIVRAVSKVIKDKNLRKELILRGNKQVKKYNWKKMAKKTQSVYNLV